MTDDKEILSVISLDDALTKVPLPPMSAVMDREEDLEVEQLAPGEENVLLDINMFRDNDKMTWK